MEQKGSNAETKRLNKIKIAKYIYQHGEASKQEIASELNLSMPTVLQRVKELLQEGVIREAGEYESTGGRKAKALSIVAEVRYAAGLDITGNHVSFVLLDAGGKVCGKKRVRCAFEDNERYYQNLGEMLDLFLEKCQVDRGDGICSWQKSFLQPACIIFYIFLPDKQAFAFACKLSFITVLRCLYYIYNIIL